MPCWDLQEDNMLTLVSKQHVGRILGLAFVAANKLLSVSQDGAIGLWTVSRCASKSANMYL